MTGSIDETNAQARQLSPGLTDAPDPRQPTHWSCHFNAPVLRALWKAGRLARSWATRDVGVARTSIQTLRRVTER